MQQYIAFGQYDDVRFWGQYFYVRIICFFLEATLGYLFYVSYKQH